MNALASNRNDYHSGKKAMDYARVASFFPYVFVADILDWCSRSFRFAVISFIVELLFSCMIIN